MIYLINQFYGQGDHLKYDLGAYLIEQGHTIKVITGNNGDDSLPLIEKKWKEEIIRIKTPRLSRTIWGRIKSYSGFLLGALQHIATLDKNSTVVVTTQPFFVAFLVALFKRKRNIKLIYNVQDLYPEILLALGKTKEKNILTRVIRKIQNFTLKRTDIVVAIGHSMKEMIIKNYDLPPEKIVIIENWGKDVIQGKCSNTYHENSLLRILYTGNMGESHEIETLWETLKVIQSENLSNFFKFWIIGQGKNYRKLKTLCLENELSFIEFLDPVSDDQLISEYAYADLSLVISHKAIEGILVPSKFYSAVMFSPVVYLGSETDTPSDHIKRGAFGYIVENGDSNALFTILKELLSNKEKLILLRENATLYYQKYLHSSLRLQEWDKLLSQFEQCNDRALD